MPIGQILSGNEIDAADVAAEIAEVTELAAYKVADGAAFPSNIVLANDADLAIAVAARRYAFESEVLFDAGAVGDLKLAWTFPTGTLYYSANYHGVAGAYVPMTDSIAQASGTPLPVGGLGIGTFGAVWFRGWCVLTAAGTFRLQAAQNTSTAENTRIKAGSRLVLRPA